MGKKKKKKLTAREKKKEKEEEKKKENQDKKIIHVHGSSAHTFAILLDGLGIVLLLEEPVSGRLV